MRVLILRPPPDNAATAAQVAALGCTPICIPLFDVEPVAWDPPDPAQFDAVAMTSANAARHGGAALSRYVHLPVFAVGAATAQAAQAAGFRDVRAGAGDAAALGAMLDGRVLHLAGDDHRPIPTRADVTTAVVYRAVETQRDPLPCADVALVHSPRAGRRLAELASGNPATMLVAISAAAAEAAGTGWAAIHIADRPRGAAMLECVARLCKAGGTSQPGPQTGPLT